MMTSDVAVVDENHKVIGSYHLVVVYFGKQEPKISHVQKVTSYLTRC